MVGSPSHFFLVFHHLIVVLVSFCSLIIGKGDYAELCFVVIKSVILDRLVLCVWICILLSALLFCVVCFGPTLAVGVL